MKPVLAFVLVLLAGCGVAGAPERPEAGVRISGDVSAGVTVSP